LLVLIPALVIDADLRRRALVDGTELTSAGYEGADGYRRNFETALQTLGAARGLIDVSTPTSVIYYIEYQRWRLLTNWRDVMSRLVPDDVRLGAKRAAAATLNVESVELAVRQSVAAIPEGEPLRELIRRTGGALQ
jgi:hypothetical protein